MALKSVFTGTVLLFVLSVIAARGAPQKNGNELALEYCEAAEDEKAEIGKAAVGKLYFFRYLQIVKLEKGDSNGPHIRMLTVEPSSEMYVEFTVRKKVSLRKAESLKQSDGVAVSGRIKRVESDGSRIVLDPVIVRYKDRLSPKIGKELLFEVDPEARIGTDTSSGRDVVKYKELP